MHPSEGSGTDQLGNLDATAGVTVNLSVPSDSHGDTLTGFEDLIGTFFDDVLTGTDGPNRIEGADGDDDLSGLGGDDTLIGDFFDFTDSGVDSADGGVGTNACDAETETNCESEPSPPDALARSSRSGGEDVVARPDRIRDASGQAPLHDLGEIGSPLTHSDTSVGSVAVVVSPAEIHEARRVARGAVRPRRGLGSAFVELDPPHPDANTPRATSQAILRTTLAPRFLQSVS